MGYRHLCSFSRFTYNIPGGKYFIQCNCSIYYRHVQINNDTAIKFYEKFGFKIEEKKDNYYKRIEPADAFVLQKDLRVDKENDSRKLNSLKCAES